MRELIRLASESCIVIFSVTLPMTRLAVGTPDAPQMSGLFIAMGRAVLAASLSAALLLMTRAPLPARRDWLPLMLLFGFISNLAYALAGSLLRDWLAQNNRLLWFNRVMALALVATAIWMFYL